MTTDGDCLRRSTNQKVGCSNHPGRTRTFAYLAPAAPASLSKVSERVSESRRNFARRLLSRPPVVYGFAVSLVEVLASALLAERDDLALATQAVDIGRRAAKGLARLLV